jgi:hypothetical protein
MGMPGDRDLQSAIDFFGTPLIVDVLLAIGGGQAPSQVPALQPYGDAVTIAMSVLTEAGAVTSQDASPCDVGRRPLMLTARGEHLYALVRQIVDLEPTSACQSTSSMIG